MTTVLPAAPRIPGPSGSRAIGQRSIRDPNVTYPLWPALTEGCPVTSTPEIQYPVEVAYDLSGADAIFADGSPSPGLRRWAELLPPLAPGLDLGEGGTPLIPVSRLADFAGYDGELFMKDESRNPTWSHKDRLNLMTVSAAVRMGAPGVVVASPLNHGGSAAAYAAAAGIRCIVVATAGGPAVSHTFLRAYGAAVVPVDRAARWPVVREIVRRLGYHPVSNMTVTHTGHAFGPEGYKTVAYEIFLQLGRRVPAAVFVPTGYGELLYGVFKGFVELREVGAAASIPAMVACEPEVRGPLARALAEGKDVAHVDAVPTAALSIACTTGGYRGIVALRESGGTAVTLSDDEMRAAQRAMAGAGFWSEVSSAAGLAALKKAVARGRSVDGPIVFISTSTGLKEFDPSRPQLPECRPEWDEVARCLRAQGVAA